MILYPTQQMIDFALNLKGRFGVEHLDKYRKVKGIYVADNAIVNAGKNRILDVMFNDGTQIANNSWFIGLIDVSGYTAIAVTDTMASHGGWNYFLNYAEGTRVAWGSGAASSQSTTNAVAATFNINGAGGNVKGIFVTDTSTKNSFTGLLWTTALFAADVPVSSGDQLKITYTVSA